MKEYELTLTIKNAVLLNLMKSRGIKTASHLSRECGANYSLINGFLKLTESPYSKKGEIRPGAEKMAKFFNLDVEFLFPEDELYLALHKNTFKAEVNKDEMLRLSGSCPSLMLEEAENENSKPFNGMLENSTLTDREKLVLKLKYKDNLSLTEIGKKISLEIGGVSRSRADQILQKAERKLRGNIYDGLDIVDSAGKYNNIYVDEDKTKMFDV